MKLLRLALAILLIIPLSLVAAQALQPASSQPAVRDGQQLLFLFISLPIFLLNLWAWTDPQALINLFSPQKTAPAPAEAEETANPAIPTLKTRLLDGLLALGLVVAAPLGLFRLASLFSPPSLLIPIFSAGIAALLASAWVLRFRPQGLNAILGAWFLLLFFVPGLLSGPKTMTVNGYLTDKNAEPIARPILLWDEAGQGYKTTSNAQGYYEFRAIPYGAYRLQLGENIFQGQPEGIFTLKVRQDFVVGLPKLAANLKPTATPRETVPPEPAPTAESTLDPNNPPQPTDENPGPNPTDEAPVSTEAFPIFTDGFFMDGIGMEVNTSAELMDWITLTDEGELCLSYPAGQQWGFVNLTLGDPSAPPRPGMNFSAYKKISFDVRGLQGNEPVFIFIKDNTDPDDRSEAKFPIQGLTTDWQTYQVALSKFPNADLTNLYVLTGFYFADPGEKTVCVRNIQYLP